MTNDEMVTIRNIAGHYIFYKIPNLNVKRGMEAGGSLRVPKEEIRQLAYQRGGLPLIQSYMCVEDEDLLRELNQEDLLDVPEYNWDDKKVVEVLTTGDIDELADALDFAPEGIKDNIKAKAYQHQIKDVGKRDLIKSQLGFDVTKAIDLQAEPKQEEKPTPRRRVSKKEASEDTGTVRRRVQK